MSKEIKRDCRAHQILDLINQGYTSNIEITAALERNQRESWVSGGRSGDERGRMAEQRVARLIDDVSYVDRAEVTTPGSIEDRNHEDIAVFLSSERMGAIDLPLVHVQVKASYSGMITFRYTTRRRLGMEDEDLDKWFRERKLILIVEEMSDRSILNEFESQLDKIIRYHTADKETLATVFPWRD